MRLLHWNENGHFFLYFSDVVCHPLNISHLTLKRRKIAAHYAYGVNIKSYHIRYYKHYYQYTERHRTKDTERASGREIDRERKETWWNTLYDRTKEVCCVSLMASPHFFLHFLSLSFIHLHTVAHLHFPNSCPNSFVVKIKLALFCGWIQLIHCKWMANKHNTKMAKTLDVYLYRWGRCMRMCACVCV